MSILDETFVFHPDSWKDWDWKSLSGLPLGEVSLTAADGAQLFGWYVESRRFSRRRNRPSLSLSSRAPSITARTRSEAPPIFSNGLSSSHPLSGGNALLVPGPYRSE